MTNIKFFNQIKTPNTKLIGGKAVNLVKLYQAGFNVPPAYIISTKLFDRVTANQQINNLINKAVLEEKGSTGKNHYRLTDSLQKIKNIIEQKPLPEFYEKEIKKFYLKLGTKKVAIRSSATCEDGSDSSFAGQFASFLAIETKDLIPMIKKCLASVFFETVFMYCSYKNISFRSIKMAIVVQKMINAQKGGVIFTSDVFNNEKDRLIIEAARGLGENVVSGLLDPHKIVFSKRDGRIVEGVLGFNKPVLSQQEAARLYQMALEIESFYGKPQDIEWAIYRDEIYILQSRPIT